MPVRVTLALLFVLALSLPAQNANAILTGIIRDPSQAPVVGARVRVVNQETNIERRTVSNDTGNYTVPSLIPGTYRVEVEISGFKRSVLSGIVLEVAQQARVDVQVEVGQVTEAITVAALTPLVETESNVIGRVVSEKSIVSIPLNGRNFMELITLAGATNTGNNATSKNTTLAGTSRGIAPSVAGAPATENNYQLDGADNREPYFNSYGLAPSVDAIREFKIQVGQYSAEYGAGGGAVINVVTRSGTNEFHGTAFEFVRNDMFDARNTFLTPTQRINALRRNQFGVSLGGPVVIPKLYNGKDRTFIFGNFDLVRQRTASLRSSVVPTEAQRAGNLTGLNAIIDPFAGGAPFPNNTIPSSRIDPISANIAKWYPAPNNAGAVQNYFNNIPGQSDQNTWLLRGDHRIANGHDFMARYADQKLYTFNPGNAPNYGGGLAVPTIKGLSSGLTSTFKPNLINEFRFGWSLIENRFSGQNAGNPIAFEAGIPFAYKDGELAGAPSTIALQRTTIGNIVESQLQRYTNGMRQFYDAVTWINGRHNWKVGADLKFVSSDVIGATNANGNYTFSGDITGDGFGDFLIGYPLTSRTQIRPNLESFFRRHMLGFYVLDDWKVTSNLTFNIGLRYEYNAPVREKFGRTTQFDPTLGNGAGGLRYAAHNTEAIPFYQEFRPDLAVGLLDREAFSVPDRNNFAPRFGFAWRPGSLVVRGGYGWYYSSAQWNNLAQNSTGAPPAVITADLRTSDIRNPDLRYNGIVGRPLTASVTTAPIGVITSLEGKMLDGYTQQWSFSLARPMGRNFVLEAQYLGSKSTHLEQVNEYNDADAPSSVALTNRVRFPKWNRVLGFSSGGTANYNALIVNAEKRYSYGLSFRGSYTYSKAMGGNNSRAAQGNVSVPQFSRNMQLETGRTTDDVTHRFVQSYNWELPIGRGKWIGAGMPRVLNAIIGGISLSGIMTIQSGLPYTPGVGTGNCNVGYSNACRPDVVGNFFLGGNGRDTPRFSRDAFDFPLNTRLHPAQPPRLGNAGINILENPGSFFWDMALMKSWQLRESIRLEFRWETFNSLNHPNYNINIFDPGNANFGRATFMNGGPRIQQLGMKLYW